MTHRDTDIVIALRRALAKRLGKEDCELWLAGGQAVDYDGAALIVTSDSQFKLDRIRSHYRSDLLAACSDVLGREVPLLFRVDVALRAKNQAESSAQHGRKSNGDPLHKSGPHADRSNGRSASNEQNGARKFASLRSFVIGENNRLALTSCEMVVDRPGEISPLYLFGPSGTGKTHLLEGVWSAIRSRRKKTVVYLSAEQFTNYFVEAIKGGGLPGFRRKYRGADVLIIDDIHFLAGKKATIAELQHTLDHMQRTGGQVVLSGDRPAGMLKELGQSIATRLASGMACPLKLADRATRLAIARQMTTARRMEIPTGVLEYVADRITGDARHICGALNRLEAATTAWGKPIDLSLAREALADLIRAGHRPLQLGDIEKAVCDVLGVEKEKLHSIDKSKAASHPRMLAMFLARKHTRAGLSEIGDHFHRSHTTVVSAEKRVRGWLSAEASLSVGGATWSVEEAIQRIEGELRVG